MATTAFSLSETVTGLRTVIVGIPDTASYRVNGTLTLPTIPEGSTENSEVVVTISQNPLIGPTVVIYTGEPGAKGFTVMANCTAGDSLEIAITSSADVDQATDAVRTTLAIG